MYKGNNRTKYVGNYSQEKTSTLVWSYALHRRLQNSETGTGLDSWLTEEHDLGITKNISIDLWHVWILPTLQHFPHEIVLNYTLCCRVCQPVWQPTWFLVVFFSVILVSMIWSYTGPGHMNKRLCYCRGTARRATSVEILWLLFDWAIDKKLC